MCDILKVLFSCDIYFKQSPEFDEQYTAALNGILNAEKIVKGRLSTEHWSLVTDYLKQVHELQELDCQLQFERGFLLGARIMQCVVQREISSVEQL